MASTVVVMQHTENIRGLNDAPTRGGRKELAACIAEAITAFSAGAKRAATIAVMPNDSEDIVTASGTVTCASVADADTVTINGVVFTAVTASPTGDQFDQSGTDTADATDLARSINASTTELIKDYVTATSAAGVVTITSVYPGRMGNTQTLASSNGTRLAVSGARLASGTGGIAAKTSVTF